jgi:hypothetical protein
MCVVQDHTLHEGHGGSEKRIGINRKIKLETMAMGLLKVVTCHLQTTDITDS